MILCIDIGFNNSGWSIIKPIDEDSFEIIKTECVHTTKSKDKKVKVSHDDASRNQHTYLSLKEVAQTNDITGVAIELPTSGAKSSNALKGMAMASAIVACLVAELGIDYHYVTPMDVKKVITESPERKSKEKKVEKEEIMEYVKCKFPDAPFPKTKKKFEHIADSVCVGLSILKTDFYKQQLSLI